MARCALLSFLLVNHSRGNGELESDAKSQLDRRLGDLKQESNHSLFLVKTCDLSYLFIYHSWNNLSMDIGSYVNYDCFANDVIFFAAELIITKRKSSEVISNLLEVESFKFKSDKGHTSKLLYVPQDGSWRQL